jgi:hypothetical protein
MVKISGKGDRDITLSLEHGSMKPVPFDLIDSYFQVSLDEGEKFTNDLCLNNLHKGYSRAYTASTQAGISLKKLYEKESNLFGTVKFYDRHSKSQQIIFKIQRNKQCQQYMNIVFIPSIKIKNSLPWPLKYRLISESQDIEENILYPQDSNPSDKMPIKQKIDIQLLVPGFDWSAPIG